MIYLISYNPPSDFSFDIFGSDSKDALIKEIKTYPGYCKCFEHSWLIASTDTIETVSSKLTKFFKTDELWMIANVNEQVCGNLTPDAWQWIKDTKAGGY